MYFSLLLKGVLDILLTFYLIKKAVFNYFVLDEAKIANRKSETQGKSNDTDTKWNSIAICIILCGFFFLPIMHLCVVYLMYLMYRSNLDKSIISSFLIGGFLYTDFVLWNYSYSIAENQLYTLL